MRQLLLACCLLPACRSATAVLGNGVLGGDTAGDTGGDTGAAGCDTTFDVDASWVVAAEGYGMVRGAAGFDMEAGSFVHAEGVYDTTVRSYDLATGTVHGGSAGDDWLVAHDDGIDLLFGMSESDSSTARIDVVDRISGEVRATIPSAGTPGVWPAVVLRDRVIALLRCSEEDRAGLSTYDLDGNVIDEWALEMSCFSWATGLVDIHPGAGVAAAHGGDLSHHAVLVDLGTGSERPLTDHGEADPDSGVGDIVVNDLAFSGDGTMLATAGGDGRLLLHDSGSGDVVGERPILPTPVNGNVFAEPDTRGPFAWSADGVLLARATVEGVIVIERMCDGHTVTEIPFAPELFNELRIFEGQPATLHFAPDGSTLVVAYEAGMQGLSAGVE